MKGCTFDSPTNGTIITGLVSAKLLPYLRWSHKNASSIEEFMRRGYLSIYTDLQSYTPTLSRCSHLLLDTR